MFKIKLKQKHNYILLLIKSHRLRLFFAMLCMACASATTAATAFLVKPMLDDIFFKKNMTMLILIPIGVIVLYFLRGVAIFGQAYLMNYIGESIIRHLRERLYKHIQYMPISFFFNQRTGTLISRITNDVNIVKGMVTTAVTRAIRDTFTIIGLIFVIFYRDWKMAILAFIVLPFAAYPIAEFGRRVRRISTGYQEAIADLTAFLHETISGNKIIKAFGMEQHEKNNFFKRTNDLFKIQMKAVIAKSLTSPIMEFIGGIGVAFVIWFGGAKVMNGTSTPGTFFSFITAVLLLYEPAKKLSTLNNMIQEGLAAADRIFDILEQKTDITDTKESSVKILNPYDISFNNIYFKYGKNLDEPMTLKNINLKVKQGQVIAFVGASGSGKSSLVSLIPRFYDVISGSLCINDIDIRCVSLYHLRSKIAIVTQEPVLFNDTIKNNILYGNQNASDQQIIDAARAAYAFDFIKDFPKGFDTVIGELGSRLSGGEKQRICIARAILKNAPILILDEATSALDTEAEQIVQKALENLMKNRTTLVIAHRLSTITNADKIVVLSQGEIKEYGNHEKLMKDKGEYYKLYNMQIAKEQNKAA